jgi:hypothetical protein
VAIQMRLLGLLILVLNLVYIPSLPWISVALDRAERNERWRWNQQQLSLCHPWTQYRVSAILLELEAEGFRPRVIQSWRSQSEQSDALDTGTSQLRFGYHNVTDLSGNPRAFAVDVASSDDSSLVYKLHLAKLASRHEMTTGIYWGLQAADLLKLQRAAESLDSTSVSDVGWDPYHVEPKSITLSQAVDLANGTTIK